MRLKNEHFLLMLIYLKLQKNTTETFFSPTTNARLTSRWSSARIMFTTNINYLYNSWRLAHKYKLLYLLYHRQIRRSVVASEKLRIIEYIYNLSFTIVIIWSSKYFFLIAFSQHHSNIAKKIALYKRFLVVRYYFNFPVPADCWASKPIGVRKLIIGEICGYVFLYISEVASVYWHFYVVRGEIVLLMW